MKFVHAEKRIQSTIKYSKYFEYIYLYTVTLKIEGITVPDVILCQTAP